MMAVFVGKRPALEEPLEVAHASDQVEALARLKHEMSVLSGPGVQY